MKKILRDSKPRNLRKENNSRSNIQNEIKQTGQNRQLKNHHLRRYQIANHPAIHHYHCRWKPHQFQPVHYQIHCMHWQMYFLQGCQLCLRVLLFGGNRFVLIFLRKLVTSNHTGTNCFVLLSKVHPWYSGSIKSMTLSIQHNHMKFLVLLMRPTNRQECECTRK